jgi:hypothetical protein
VRRAGATENPTSSTGSPDASSTLPTEAPRLGVCGLLTLAVSLCVAPASALADAINRKVLTVTEKLAARITSTPQPQ